MTTDTAARHGVHLARLARRGTASVAGAGFSAVSGVGLVVIVTNGFTPALAGALFAATSAFLIVESVALLGVDTGLVRCLPAQLTGGRAQDVGRTLALALLPAVCAALLAGATLFVTAAGLAPILVGSAQAGPMTTMLQVLAVLLPVATAYDALQAATRGMGTMRPTVLVDNIGRLCLQAVAVLGVYLAGAGTLALVLAWSLPYGAGLAMTAGWLAVLVRRRAAARTGPARDWGMLAGEFWWFTAPRAIARITQTALKRSDIVLVAALASPADAALYTAATRFVVFGQLLVQAVQQALAPHLSALFARDDTAAARSVFQAATTWSMLAAWPIYLVFAGFAPILMRVFGDGYETGADVVVILSLTMLLATVCGSVDSVLLMAGRSWLSLANNSVALVVNLSLNLVLIPAAGIRGAALAWAAAIIVRNLLPLVQVQRSLGMWPGTRASGYVAAGALVCFGMTSAVARLGHLPGVASGAVVGVGALAYLGGIWLLRGPLRLDAFRSALLRRRHRSQPAAAVR